MRDRKDKLMDAIAGALVNEHRQAAKLSLRALGDKVGLTGQILNSYEAGQTSMRVCTFAKLCEALGVDPSHTFDLVLVRYREQLRKKKCK